MKKLAVLLLILIALVGVCSAAQAAVDEVTVSITVVDSVTLKPTPKNLYVKHLTCWYSTHTPESCTCYQFDDGIHLPPCPCDEGESVQQPYARGDENAVCTFTIKTGHRYHLYLFFHSLGYDEYHLYEYPGVVMYADPATGELSFTANKIELVQTGDYTFQWRLHTSLLPTAVNLNATKLMDGKDPGDLKFAFKIWQLPVELGEQYYNTDLFLSLLGEEEMPPWKDEYDEMEWLDALNDAFTQEYIDLILERFHTMLQDMPYTIVYNDGKNIPILNKTLTAYDFHPHTNVPGYHKFLYAITEVEQSGNGICEDNAVYIVGGTISVFYPTLPSSVEIENSNAVSRVPHSTMFAETRPIEFSLTTVAGLSNEGFVEWDVAWEENRFDAADLSRDFVFRNTTCPYADPGPTATPEPAPDVPATADGGFPIYWAALLLVGVMAMILRPRRA